MTVMNKLQTTSLPHDVVAAVKALVPEIRAAQAETDQLAHPPEHIVEKLREAGAYRLTISKEFGGLEADMTTWMDTVSEIGRGDAGIAWAVSLVASCNWLLTGFYPKHVIEEVYSKPNVSVAGVFSGRRLTARKVPGGIFIEKGIWFFNSGVYQATWDMLGVPLFNEAGDVIGPGIALLPMSDVKLLHDWNTSGLRGSGSTNVSVENVFIPDERIVPLFPLVDGSFPPTYKAPVTRVAFTPAMVHLLAYPLVGAGLHMIENFMETLPRRDIKMTPYTKAGEASVTHLQIGEATAKIETAKLLLEHCAREMDDWSEKSEYMPQIIRARQCRDAAYADRLLWEGVDILGTASGGSFSWLSNVANRIWQDVKVGSMHPYISLSSNYETYGRMLSGVKPDLMPM